MYSFMSKVKISLQVVKFPTNLITRLPFFPTMAFESVDCKVGLCARLSLNFYNNTCVSFTNSATVRRLEQVQLCNWRTDQSADNIYITGLKYAKECLILKYKYIQNPWPCCSVFIQTQAEFILEH